MAEGLPMSRYARQIVLPEVGQRGQDRLRESTALVVGAGGLGAPALLYLAGAGLGSIAVVDDDRVEETNLHRQPLYRIGDVGLPKAEAAAEALRGLNPEVEIQPVTRPLDPGCASDLVAAADVVLDCADTFAASFALSDACMDARRPLVSASALGLSGYAGGFCAGAPSLRAVFPELPNSAANCSTAGVLGPVVGAIGSIQAQMAMAVLLGLSPSPLGRMLTYDARTLRVSGFRFDDAPEPDRVDRFVAVSQIGPGDLVVDLRAEAAAPFRSGALHLPPDRLGELEPTPETKRVVLACATGLRAHAAARTVARRWPGPIGLLAIPGSLRGREGGAG